MRITWKFQRIVVKSFLLMVIFGLLVAVSGRVEAVQSTPVEYKPGKPFRPLDGPDKLEENWTIKEGGAVYKNRTLELKGRGHGFVTEPLTSKFMIGLQATVDLKMSTYFRNVTIKLGSTAIDINGVMAKVGIPRIGAKGRRYIQSADVIEHNAIRIVRKGNTLLVTRVINNVPYSQDTMVLSKKDALTPLPLRIESERMPGQIGINAAAKVVDLIITDFAITGQVVAPSN